MRGKCFEMSFVEWLDNGDTNLQLNSVTVLLLIYLTKYPNVQGIFN